MKENSKRKKQAKVLRNFREIHRITGALLFVLFLFISITGLLLGWKKHSGGMLLPETQVGTSTDLKAWLPIDNLYTISRDILHDSVSTNLSANLDRIDIRQTKGSVKFVFSEHLWEIQLDGSTGKLLHIGRRYADLIEHIHDGSVLDDWLGTTNGVFKVVYTTVTGLALLLFTVTGFWLWYGPKRMREMNKKG